MSHLRRPARTWLAWFAGLALVCAAAVWLVSEQPPIVAWLLAANAIALLLWGIDKWNAKRGAARIPESTLHWMGALGAAPATLTGMLLFRHKRSKWTFRVLHPLALIGWIAALGWLYRDDLRGWIDR